MKQLKYFFYFLEKQGVKSNGSYFRQKKSGRIGPIWSASVVRQAVF